MLDTIQEINGHGFDLPETTNPLTYWKEAVYLMLKVELKCFRMVPEAGTLVLLGDNLFLK